MPGRKRKTNNDLPNVPSRRDYYVDDGYNGDDEGSNSKDDGVSVDDNSDLPDYHAVYFSDSFPVDYITLTLPHMVPPLVLAADPAGNLQTADPQPAGAGNVD